ncbi:hypothetical protein A8W25_17090 [Streptomyces sp. ERV7]|nr:hypothetical protein A8W25_17090 [Streptomyces sp. ERV7]
MRSAIDSAVRTWRRAAAGSDSHTRSDAWSSICWLDRPWASVSWISMERRWRSASVPSRRSVAASSRRVRIRSSMSCRCRSPWRCIWTNTAVATAATAGGATTRFGSTPSASISCAATTNAVSRATSTSAARVGSVRSPV